MVTRLARELDRWVEEAAAPALIFILIALFARGLPWILGEIASGR